jgi:hypothetical protein
MDALAILGGLQAILKLGNDAKTNLELREIVSDARQATLDLREKMQDQQEEIRVLRAQLAIRDSITFDRETNVYRDAANAPFCPKCLDGEGKACRMDDRESSRAWKCMTCECVVWKPEKSERQKAKARPDTGWVT